MMYSPEKSEYKPCINMHRLFTTLSMVVMLASHREKLPELALKHTRDKHMPGHAPAIHLSLSCRPRLNIYTVQSTVCKCPTNTLSYKVFVLHLPGGAARLSARRLCRRRACRRRARLSAARLSARARLSAAARCAARCRLFALVSAAAILTC